MSDVLQIRKADGADLMPILEIENDCFGDDRFSKQELKYLILISKDGCYVLEDNGRVVAYLSILARSRTTNLRIYSLAVHSSARGKHYGQKMIEFAISYAKERKFKSVTLEVKVTNQAAISLYRKNGFVEKCIRENYYHDGSNAFYMQCNVD